VAVCAELSELVNSNFICGGKPSTPELVPRIVLSPVSVAGDIPPELKNTPVFKNVEPSIEPRISYLIPV
tara:strand:- start:5 stop:211 length:207 start_codon:yes stop_codon:yes gene_type:complete